MSGVTVTSSNVGRLLPDLLTTLTLENEAARAGIFHTQTNVGKALILPRADFNDILGPHVSQPQASDSGTVTIDEYSITPQDTLGYLEFDPNADFREYWDGPLRTQGSFADAMLSPRMMREFVMGVAENMAEDYGRQFLRGEAGVVPAYNSKTKADTIDGLVTVAAADPTVLKAAIPSIIDETNIFAKLDELLDLLPLTVRYKTDLSIMMSKPTAEIYLRAREAQPYKGPDVTVGIDQGATVYRGVKIITFSEFPPDTILITLTGMSRNSNCWMAQDFPNDRNILLIDKVTNNGDLHFMKSATRTAVGIPFGQYAALHTL